MTSPSQLVSPTDQPTRQDARPRVQVVGPYNSGTCLMFNYLDRLFDIDIRYNRPFWKHSVPPEYRLPPNRSRSMARFEPPLDTIAQTTFVVMVRNPYFWLSSAVRSPYSIRFPSGAEGRDARMSSPLRFFEQDFDHPLSVWSTYYRAYQDVLALHAELIFVRLEDLVDDPDRELGRLGRFRRRQGVDWNATVRAVFEEPAKVHDEPCVNGHEARRRYRTERIPEEIGRHNLAAVNRGIDRDLAEGFGYRIVSAKRKTWISPRVARPL